MNEDTVGTELADLTKRLESISIKLNLNSAKIDTQTEILSQRIRYGDRNVEALVTIATDHVASLTRRVDTIESEMTRIQVQREDYLSQKIEKNSTRILTIVIAVFGWLVAIATSAIVLIK